MPSPAFTTGDDVFELTTDGTYNFDLLAGNDKLTLSAAGATTTANMNDGDDIVRHNAGTATVLGGLGADRFDIYGSGLTADGQAGNDSFNVRGGVSTNLAGGSGADRFTLFADGSSLTIHGGDDNDIFAGSGHLATGAIYGDAGADYFSGFISGITLDGGLGNDRYRLLPGSSAPAIVEHADEGTDKVEVARGYSYTLPTNVENLTVLDLAGSTSDTATINGNGSNNIITGSANLEVLKGAGGDDKIYGLGGNDNLSGATGNDYLDGGAGNDKLTGGIGNDTLQGGTGNDIMTGNDGNDVYWVDSQYDQVNELAGEGTDTVKLTGNYFVMPDNVERAYQIGGVDGNVYEIDGNSLSNLLVGGNGIDTLNGGDGNDTLKGGNATDALAGGRGNDILDGGAGDDSVWGWYGQDRLTGGSGNDSFQYYFADESTPAAPDQIMDFTPDGNGTGDVLNFTNFDADTSTGTTEHLTWANHTPTAHALWSTVTNNGDGTYEVDYFADVNGDTTADFKIHVHQIGTAVAGVDILLGA